MRGSGYMKARFDAEPGALTLPHQSHRPHSRAVLRYAAGWLVAGLAAVGLAFALLRLGGDEEVSLPPVRQTDFTEAAVAAGCELRGDRPAQRLAPPVVGPRAAPARPGVYSRPLSSRALIGAMRMGTVVIHYRPPLSEDRVEQLQKLQQAVPVGTIVAPYDGMRYALAVTAWRRLLGCRRFAGATIDAVRLFRGRFIGSGPDR
ncbi:MAG: DUF3105 domain-containing protein [Actinomycetota bacterium]|nr:DUF3105 domain-containing protein [Actinomycetota bacterium]